MKRKKYQAGGESVVKDKAYYDARNARIREQLASGLNKIGSGFWDAAEKNIDRLDWVQDEQGNWSTTSGIIPSYLNIAGSFPGMLAGLGTDAAAWLIRNVGKDKVMTKEQRDEFNNKFRPQSHSLPKQAGGLRRYQKGGQKKLKKRKEGFKDSFLLPPTEEI